MLKKGVRNKSLKFKKTKTLPEYYVLQCKERAGQRCRRLATVSPPITHLCAGVRHREDATFLPRAPLTVHDKRDYSY